MAAPAVVDDVPAPEVVAGADASVEDVALPPPSLELQDRTCALRARGGAVSTDCPASVASCAEVLRADVAPPTGDEVVSRCVVQQGAVFLVVSSGDEVLEALRIDGVDDGAEPCGEPPLLRIEAVDAVDDAQRELLVRATGCYVPGAYSDWDVLLRWRAGALGEVARTGLSCSSRGNTGDPDAPPPPRNARYSCSGGYLDLAGPPTARTLSTRDYEDRVVSGNRGRDRRTLLGNGGRARAFRWDPDAQRFTLDP